MKGKLVAFLTVLCIASLIAAGANAKGKPVKPEKPVSTETELIVFTGDLSGGQEVEGCCPNAGPFPDYTMTLDFAVGDNLPGLYDGQLFTNYYGAGRNRQYIVQFWTEDFGIEIIGGEIFADKKTKTLTAVFTDADCRDIDTKALYTKVNFALSREPY